MDSSEIGRAYKLDVAVAADAKMFLSSLRQELVKRDVKPRKDVTQMISELWHDESEKWKRYYTSNGDAIESWENS